MKLIDKDKVVEEIERIKKEECPTDTYEGRCKMLWFEQFSSFIDTLEVKEVYEHNDSDLDSILEGIGVEHDSKLAKMFKTAFYNGIDTYLAQKGE